MILSDKYKLEEDNYNLTLSKKTIIQKGDNAGDIKWIAIGYYSPTLEGRVQVYNKLINLGISEEEDQGLENIIEIIKKAEEDIREFLS